MNPHWSHRLAIHFQSPIIINTVMETTTYYRTMLELLQGNRDSDPFSLLSGPPWEGLQHIITTIIHFQHTSPKYSEPEQPDPSRFFWENSSKVIYFIRRHSLSTASLLTVLDLSEGWENQKST